MARYSDRCSACHREVGVERFHAGFGDQGFIYCDRDSTILTWDSLDPSWTSLVGEVHPWMLSPEQKVEVEAVAPRVLVRWEIPVLERAALSVLRR
jgi:hypothetical protein